MAVTLSNADKVLKTYYLDAITEQLNNTSPFFAKIEKNSNDVYGKEVKKLVAYGLNGGVGAGGEESTLPSSAGNLYGQITVPLKNLYGTIEITDKALRASENNSGAFVNLLNAEMDGLIKASKYNFSRMLFGDGTGVLATVVSFSGNDIVLDNVQGFQEGMSVDFYDSEYSCYVIGFTSRRIVKVDRTAKKITISGVAPTEDDLFEGCEVVVQGSKNMELTGLKAIFDTSSNLYGMTRATNSWLNPYTLGSVGSITEAKLQTAIDAIEEAGGETPDLIICSWGVRRALQALFSTNKRTVDTVMLEGGFSAMSYNGIPIVADRFCPSGTMYILNTKDFTLSQLCDWQWLSDDEGKILKQIAGRPIYTATLVKYAELICARPYAQGKLSGITEV